MVRKNFKPLKRGKLRASYVCECGAVIQDTSQIAFALPNELRTDDLAFVTTEQKELKLYVSPEFKEMVGVYEDRTLRSKYCAECHALLPENVGQIKTYKVAILGRKGSGKTVYTLGLTDLIRGSINRFPAAEKEGFLMTMETYHSAQSKRYLHMLSEMKGGKYPDPTPVLARELHLSYKVENHHLGSVVNLLFYDLHGEIGNQTFRRHSSVNYADAIFFVVDATELNSQEAMAENEDYLKNLFLSMDRKIPVYVILTKTDTLTSKNELTAANSLREQANGSYTSVHASGFSFKEYEKNKKLAMEYLDEGKVKLLPMIKRYLNASIVYPFAVSVINGNHAYFSVEQPLLHLLARSELYPSKGGC